MNHFLKNFRPSHVVDRYFPILGCTLFLSLCLSQPCPAKDAVDGSPDGAPVITLGNALIPYASGEALFLDARSSEAYDLGHIQSAVSLPAATKMDALPDQQLEKLSSFSMLIVYCDDSDAAASTALSRDLIAINLPARVLQGGWPLWLKNGLPVAPADLGALYGHGRQHCPSCEPEL